MPINTPHPLYAARLAQWQMCRDAYDGEDAVKSRKETYLPKVDPGQSGTEYVAYLKRALYYEAVGRSVDGFTGAISRKPHVIELPAGMDEFAADVTTDGVALDEFIRTLCGEDFLTGRGGVLVDWSEAKQRAYLAIYSAESIYNWPDDDADLAVEGLVLTETVFEKDASDPFKKVATQQFRQLHISDGAYTVTIWRKRTDPTPDGGEWFVHKVERPTKRGVTRDAIPFFWLSPLGKTRRVTKPPLLGLVNVAMSHYRTSADLEHGRHFCGMPTLWVSGMQNTEEPLRIGAGAAIILPDPQAKVGYAEFTGQGLGSLEKALESKEHMMAVLGAAVFADGKAGVEAAETARIRTSGETSLLMAVTSAVEETMRSALECVAEWMGVAGKIELTLNRDFMDETIDGRMLLALISALQANGISLETFLYNLQQAEMLPPETVIADEATLLQARAAKAAEDAAKLAQATKASAAP